MSTAEAAVRADTDPRFYRRFLLIGVAGLAFALYCTYDGAVKYPHQRERALEYLRLEEEGQEATWEQVAQDRGWSTEPPGEPKTEYDFLMQFFMAGMSTIVGLAMLFVVWRSRGRWVEANESGLTSSWGQNLVFDQVLAVDKRLWRKKGIAKIKYQQGKRKKRFVLDDYKFNQDPMDQILVRLESKIDVDKIVNGRPEPTPEEPAESL